MTQNGTTPPFPFAADVAFQAGDIVFATDRLGRVVYWNKEAEEISGYSSEEVFGKPYAIACRIETEGEAAVDLAGILGGRDFAGARRCHTRAGGEVALYLFATVGRNQVGEAAGVVFVGRDVTGLWSAEEAVQASADKYRVLFENTLDAVAVADIHGRVLEANPACLRLYGYAAQDVKSMNLLEVVVPEDRPAAAKAMANLAAGRQVANTMRMRRKDGTGFLVDLLASTMTVGGERRILWVARDVTERVRSEQARSQSELMYRTVFESANDAVFIETVDGRILDVNHNGCELLGYTQSELARKKVADLVPAESRVWLQRVTDAILRDGTFRTEAVRVHKDGHRIPVEISAATMGLDGKTVVLSIVRNITQRKQAEQALRESEEKFRGVAEQSPNMIFINLQGRVVYANQQSADVMGYPREEFYASGFDFKKLFAPESMEKITAVNDRHARGEEVEPCEYTLVTKDGRRLDAIITTRLIDYAGTRAVLGIVTDITEREAAERALREERDRSQKYLELVGSILVALDDGGCVTLLNRRGCQVLGVTEAEALGRNWFDSYVPEATRAEVKAVFDSLMAGNLEPLDHYQNPVLTASGEERLIVWHNALLRDEQGRPTGSLSSGEDITERERALKALRESEEKYRSVVERASDGICVIQDGRLRYTNRRLAHMVGYAPEELAGREFFEYVHPDDRATVVDRYRGRFAGQQEPTTYSVRILSRSGGELPVEVNVGLANYGGAPAEIVLVRDITERKRAEQELRESEERYRRLQETSPEGVAVHQNGKVVLMNPAGARMLGYDNPAELLGLGVAEFLHPDDRYEVLDRMRSVLASGPTAAPARARFRHRDGSYVSLEVANATLTWQGKPAVQVVFRDVSAREAAELALRESERQYRTALEAMRDPVHVADADLRIVMVNQAFGRWLRENGLDEAVLGKTVFEAFPFLPDKVRDEYRQVFDTGQPVTSEEETEAAGRSFATETTKTPVTEQGRVVRVLTVVRDVTERKQLARVAQETADELRAVLDNSPGAIAGECDGVLVYANQRFARLFGYDAPADVIGRPAADFDAPQDRELLAGYTRLREQEKGAPTTYSFHGLRRDGTVLPLEATISTYRSLGRLHVLAFIREQSPSQ